MTHKFWAEIRECLATEATKKQKIHTSEKKHFPKVPHHSNAPAA